MDHKPDNEDYLFMGSTFDEGDVSCIRHRSNGECELTTLSPVTEGKSIQGELLELTPRNEGGYSVKVLYDGRSGPPKVNSRAYKSGWDNVFKKSEKKTKSNSNSTLN